MTCISPNNEVYSFKRRSSLESVMNEVKQSANDTIKPSQGLTANDIRQTVYMDSINPASQGANILEILLEYTRVLTRWRRYIHDTTVYFKKKDCEILGYDDATHEIQHTLQDKYTHSRATSLCKYSEKLLKAKGYKKDFIKQHRCVVCPLCGVDNPEDTEHYCTKDPTSPLMEHIEKILGLIASTSDDSKTFKAALREPLYDIEALFTPGIKYMIKPLKMMADNLQKYLWETIYEDFQRDKQKYVTVVEKVDKDYNSYYVGIPFFRLPHPKDEDKRTKLLIFAMNNNPHCFIMGLAGIANSTLGATDRTECECFDACKACQSCRTYERAYVDYSTKNEEYIYLCEYDFDPVLGDTIDEVYDKIEAELLNRVNHYRSNPHERYTPLNQKAGSFCAEHPEVYLNANYKQLERNTDCDDAIYIRLQHNRGVWHKNDNRERGFGPDADYQGLEMHRHFYYGFR